MSSAPVSRYLIACALTLGSNAVLAQPSLPDPGKREFENNCATCHGRDGKGNGPTVELLRRSPPDLTLLAKNNQGILPINRMFEVIEGANVASHGSRDMPIWGRDYRIEDAQNLLEARGHYDAAALVRVRILTLVEYINRIQVR